MFMKAVYEEEWGAVYKFKDGFTERREFEQREFWEDFEEQFAEEEEKQKEYAELLEEEFASDEDILDEDMDD